MGAKDGICAPHGLPVDLLDRLMIIKTAMYNAGELREIIKLRAKAEGVDITAEAMNKISDVRFKLNFWRIVYLKYILDWIKNVVAIFVSVIDAGKSARNC